MEIFSYALGYLAGTFFQLFSWVNQNGEFILPPLLVATAVYVYARYTRALFIAKQEWVMLDIRLPKEQLKSPAAMELALLGLHITGREGTWYDRIVLGKHRPWFSLELVSIEGDIHFLIRTERAYQKIIENSFYAQFPTAEVRVTDDYVKNVPYGQEKSEWGIFGTEFVLTKEDGYPIKTYVDYGLSEDPKEEFKIDPLTPLLEFFGSVGKGEQIWLQILIRGTKKENILPGGIMDLLGKPQDWKKEAKDLVKKLKKEFSEGESYIDEEGEEKVGRTNMTPGQRLVIEAIERNAEKNGFDCGIRAMYLANGKAFKPENIAALMALMKQFSSSELNGFRPQNVTGTDYPWQEYTHPGYLLKGKKYSTGLKATLYNAYIRRSWFYPPYTRKWFVLSSEELATLYHFPGQVAQTPTFARIESKRGEAPPNLPH